MPRKSEESLTRVHLYLFADDVPKLHQLFDRTIGFSGAVRYMVRLGLKKLESNALKEATPLNLDLGDTP